VSDSSEKRKARDEQKARYLRRLADGHAERFRAMAGRDAMAVAGETHAAMDEMLARDRKRDPASAEIACRRGCSHCCSNPVEIWPQEAVLLVAAAREAGIALDAAKLGRQAGQTIESWLQQPAADRACVFLGGDGACRVYDSRPNACRKLLVTSDPALCDTNRPSAPITHHPSPVTGVERWFSWEAEMLELAALETLGRGLMPGLLLAVLKADGG